MSRRRVTFLVHDLAANPIVRAAPLAEALSADFDVDVVGLLLSGDAPYAPFRGRFPIRALPCKPTLRAILAAGRALAAEARGDVLYACKPLLTTLRPALMAARDGRAVLLDVEDDEWAARAVDRAAPGLRGIAQRLRDTHRLWARAAHPLTRRVDAVTVSTRRLERRYGGTLVRHGPDGALFDPDLPHLRDRAALRGDLHLPHDRHLALFAGVPRPHKGWTVLLDALRRPEAGGWDLVIAGPERAEHAAARAALGPRVHSLGAMPNEAMPRLLAACDAVPVPQRDTAYARAQLPAKALEAMAMRVPVVATRVGDLPEILGDGARGWLVPPDDAPALARAFAEVAARADEARARTEAARAWFLAEASVGAIRGKLVPLVERALAEAAA